MKFRILSAFHVRATITLNACDHKKKILVSSPVLFVVNRCFEKASILRGELECRATANSNFKHVPPICVFFYTFQKNKYITCRFRMFVFSNSPQVKQFSLRCAYRTTDSFVSTSFKISVEKRGAKHNVITTTIERFFAIFHFFFHLRILNKTPLPSSHIPPRLAKSVRHYIFLVGGKLYIS